MTPSSPLDHPDVDYLEDEIQKMLTFFLLVNRQGQTRMSKYYNYVPVEERVMVEGEIIRKCLSRKETQCSFMEYKNTKVIYRRYASLYFIVGADILENELGVLEFIHHVVETLDSYFESVVSSHSAESGTVITKP